MRLIFWAGYIQHFYLWVRTGYMYSTRVGMHALNGGGVGYSFCTCVFGEFARVEKVCVEYHWKTPISCTDDKHPRDVSVDGYKPQLFAALNNYCLILQDRDLKLLLNRAVRGPICFSSVNLSLNGNAIAEIVHSESKLVWNYEIEK